MAGQTVLSSSSLFASGVFLFSGGSGLRRGWRNCPDPPSGQLPVERLCEPLYKKDAEPHLLSPFIAEASLKKEKENKNTEDGVANPLPLCVPKSSILHTLFLLIQTNNLISLSRFAHSM